MRTPARSTIGWNTRVRSSGSASSGRQSGTASTRVPGMRAASASPARGLSHPHPARGATPGAGACADHPAGWPDGVPYTGRDSMATARGSGTVPDEHRTRGAVPVPALAAAAASDVLRDPHRIAAARRLLVEVPGPAAFYRLSARAARRVGAGHAKVTLFTDQDTVVGGYGLPAGVIGGPALLTGALSALVVQDGVALDVPSARDDARVAHLPAGTSGQVQGYLGAPLVAASGDVVGGLPVYAPEPRAWSDDATELLEQLSASVVAELELSA